MGDKNLDNKNIYDEVSKQPKNKTLLWLIIAAMVLCGIYYKKDEIPNIFKTPTGKVKVDTVSSVVKNNNEKFTKLSGENSNISLKINPLEDYDGNSKAKMYEIRKSYVKQSLFDYDGYEPNEEVFGQLEDGKPWWGFPGAICSENADGEVSKYEGLSTVSRFLNNPNLLVGTYFSFNLNSYKGFEKFCDAETSKLIPFDLKYNSADKQITARYKMSYWPINNRLNYGEMSNIPYPLILTGMNARDFGYNYMFISDLNNIAMLNSPNANQDVHTFADFLHTGNSCGAPGGCNNISPRQPELEYYLVDLPAAMDIKLWMEKPSSKSDMADINYRIVFEE